MCADNMGMVKKIEKVMRIAEKVSEYLNGDGEFSDVTIKRHARNVSVYFVYHNKYSGRVVVYNVMDWRVKVAEVSTYHARKVRRAVEGTVDFYMCNTLDW